MAASPASRSRRSELEQIVDALDANGWLAGTRRGADGLPADRSARSRWRARDRARARRQTPLRSSCAIPSRRRAGGLYLDAGWPPRSPSICCPDATWPRPTGSSCRGSAARPSRDRRGARRRAALGARTCSQPRSRPAKRGSRTCSSEKTRRAPALCLDGRRSAWHRGLAGGALSGACPQRPCAGDGLGRAVAAVEASIGLSAGRDELSLAGAGSGLGGGPALADAGDLMSVGLKNCGRGGDRA